MQLGICPICNCERGNERHSLAQLDGSAGIPRHVILISPTIQAEIVYTYVCTHKLISISDQQKCVLYVYIYIYISVCVCGMYLRMNVMPYANSSDRKHIKNFELKEARANIEIFEQSVSHIVHVLLYAYSRYNTPTVCMYISVAFNQISIRIIFNINKNPSEPGKYRAMLRVLCYFGAFCVGEDALGQPSFQFVSPLHSHTYV